MALIATKNIKDKTDKNYKYLELGKAVICGGN